MKTFIGRKAELNRLHETANIPLAAFVLVTGRRRVGKSSLVEQFGKNFKHFYTFTGLAPTKQISNHDQLNEFSRQIAKNFQIPFSQYDDWSDALWAVAERVKSGKVLLFFDEISWMGSKDPTFLGKIKNAWDLHFKKNNQLIFVVCGSASAWIKKNILSNTGFVGRVALTLTLRELHLKDCNKFWPKHISAYEKLKLLSVTGGIPRYLEAINFKKSAEENIKRLCFLEGSFLVNEFNQIFSDVLLRESQLYKKILKILVSGPKDQSKIQHSLKLKTQGRLAEYLLELIQAGFISRDYTWNLKKGSDAKLSQYRLKDNYLRFYLKYIDKNLSKIQRGLFNFKSLQSLPEWSSIMGLQFENLVLNNRDYIHQSLGIQPEEIVCSNPYFQKKTTQKKGCQIDYMIQTRFQTLFICEIKFSQSPIPLSIIDEMEKKIKALQYYKQFSCRPVLVHVNGVTEEVKHSDYFATIIDLSDCLT